MALKLFEIINIVLAAIVGGMYWGPWLALTKSLNKFTPSVFLSIVNRLNKNMAPLMTLLIPISLLATIAVLFILYQNNFIISFYYTFIGFLFFILALIVTMTIEVPIVKQITTWTEETLPSNWEYIRDKWSKFHIVRISAGIIGLVCFLIATLFQI